MAVGGNVKFTVIDNSKEVKTAFERQMAMALEEIGMEAEANAIKEVQRAVYDTPESPSYKRTGNLKNKIGHAHDAEAAYVGDNAEYAIYVEMGTSKMPPRPFIRPAVENHLNEYKEIAEDHLRGGGSL